MRHERGCVSGERAHPDAELSQQQLVELRQRLIDERRAFSSNVESLACVLNDRPDCSISDWADAAAYQENQGRTAGVATQQRERLTDVDAALKRLEDGTYGVSEKTGEPISYERLLALPWARTTMEEQGD